MGYTTDFVGAFDITPPLTPEQVQELKTFSSTRHEDPNYPGIWCDWEPNDLGTELQWNESEKFYDYIEWLEFLIQDYFEPWDRQLNGTVTWQGEEPDDRGRIIIENNTIKIQNAVYQWVDAG